MLDNAIFVIALLTDILFGLSLPAFGSGPVRIVSPMLEI